MHFEQYINASQSKKTGLAVGCTSVIERIKKTTITEQRQERRRRRKTADVGKYTVKKTENK